MTTFGPHPCTMCPCNGLDCTKECPKYAEYGKRYMEVAYPELHRFREKCCCTPSFASEDDEPVAGV